MKLREGISYAFNTYAGGSMSSQLSMTLISPISTRHWTRSKRISLLALRRYTNRAGRQSSTQKKEKIDLNASKILLLITAFTVFVAEVFAGQCPDAPAGIRSDNTNDVCSYQVHPDKFSDIAFIHFFDELSRNANGFKKLVTFPAGTYRFSRSITISGAGGWSVQIIGAGSQLTKLVFNNVNGVDLDGPYALGLVDRLTINGNDKRGIVNDALKDKYGVLARRGANIRLGTDVVVEEFSRAGVQAYMSSTIFAKDVVSRNNGSDGFVSSYNSTLYAGGAVADGNRGTGFFCEGAASLFAEKSTSRRAITDRTKGQRGGDGYTARLGAVIAADGSLVHGNEDRDFVAITHGFISAVDVKTVGKSILKITVMDGGTVKQ